MRRNAIAHRVAVIHDRAHTRIDDRFQVRPGIMHPVSRPRKVVVHRIACLSPWALRADLRSERRASEVRVKRGRVRVGVAREDKVNVIWPRER